MNDNFHDDAANEPPGSGGFFSWLLINIAGADYGFVMKRCPGEANNLKASAIIPVLGFIYNATIFSLVGNYFFGDAGHFNPYIIVPAVALALFILATDSFIFYRCAHLKSGFEQLKQRGLVISVPGKVRWMIACSLVIRLIQSLCLAVILGGMTSLSFYSKDINARIERNDLVNNSSEVRRISEQADIETRRANEAISTTTANINTLNRQINALRQLDLRARRAGMPANATTANSSQINALESRRVAEETKLTAQKAELTQLQSGRNDRLRSGLNGPTAIRQNSGVLAQINALEQIAGDDWKILLVIVLIEFIAVGFDLAPILAKLNYLPSIYSALKAREYLERMQQIVDEMVEKDTPRDVDDDPEPPPANDNHPLTNGHDKAANDNLSAEPLKRKRGRPRKNLELFTNGSGPQLPTKRPNQ